MKKGMKIITAAWLPSKGTDDTQTHREAEEREGSIMKATDITCLEVNV